MQMKKIFTAISRFENARSIVVCSNSKEGGIFQ